MKTIFKTACIFILLSYLFSVAEANAQAILGNREIKLTLIPDYVNRTIRFDGQIRLRDSTRFPDLDDLPLNVENRWQTMENKTWNLTGSIRGGKLILGSKETYHLTFERIQLQPDDQLHLNLPFVNLDYSQIQPAVDDPDQTDTISRQFTHSFTYNAGDSGQEIPRLDIPFTPVITKIDLTLVPLLGKALVGQADGLRLYGRVHFENIRDFDEFSRYCQIASGSLKNGDYRVGHLLYILDFPAYFGLDVLNPVYEKKPTSVSLRSELIACQYEKSNQVGTVEAAFSGRIISNLAGAKSFPPELFQYDFPDGNYAFSPPDKLFSKGVQGYQIILGQIYLAPGDVLTLAIPNTQVQADFLRPSPSAYNNTEGLQIVYTGPKSFTLSLPYVPKTALYGNEFPSILRPAISLLENQLGEFSVRTGSAATWIVLSLGIFLYLLSEYIIKGKWLSISIASWLVMTTSFSFGVRGSFGLLCVAVLIYITQPKILGHVDGDRREDLIRPIKGLVGFAIIALGVYMDAKGTILFKGLADAELSPLTPVVLIVTTTGLFLLIYVSQPNAKRFMRSDLPVLILLMVVLSLYDAFDKSLLALAILFIAGVYITGRALQNNKGGARRNDSTFGDNLRRRGKLVFRDRIVPIAMLILMIFAIANDLTSTYANEMQVLITPLVAPLVIPLLVVVSVFLAFTSIAFLFVLLYPFLPFQTGHMKAVAFAMVLFLVFLFGIGTDERLIMSLPDILVGRVIYYLSVPMLIGVYLDINNFMQKENKRRSAEGEESKGISFQTASSLYFKDLRGLIGTLAGIVSLVAPTVYAFLSSQPVMVTYFSLLEKLLLLPT